MHSGILENEAILFLEGKGTDAKGRTLEDYFNFTLYEWEDCHDHIQWAFPSVLPSRFNINAPVLTEQFVDKLDHKRYLNVRGNITLLINRYKQSIGLAGYHTEEGRFVWGDVASWAGDGFNHNFNRITRVLLCQRVFSLSTHSQSDMCLTFDTVCRDIAHPFWHNDALRTAFGFWLEANYCNSPWEFGK